MRRADEAENQTEYPEIFLYISLSLLSLPLISYVPSFRLKINDDVIMMWSHLMWPGGERFSHQDETHPTFRSCSVLTCWFRLTSRHLIDLRELVLLHLLRMYLTLHQLVSKCVCQLCSVFSPHSRFSRRSSPLIKRLLIDEALPSTCCSTLLFVWWSSKNSSLHDPRPPTHGCE